MNRFNHVSTRSNVCAGLVLAGLALSPSLLLAQPTGSATGDSSQPQATGTPQATTTQAEPRDIRTITGEGTIGRIPRFTGPNAIGNSAITQDAGKIGIGTT